MSLHIYNSPQSLAKGLAAWIVGDINSVLHLRKRYSFVLSGGSTPELLYKILAANYSDGTDWSRVDFFWGDERFVPKDDVRNNARMAYQLLLNPLKIEEHQVFPIPTETTPEASVVAYQATIDKYFAATSSGSFDFVLLGMGKDAHTLSLFPGEELPNVKDASVAHTFYKADQLNRITLMPSIVNDARTVAFMVQGKDKAATLKEVLQGNHDVKKYPAQNIVPNDGNLLWFVDEKAACDLRH